MPEKIESAKRISPESGEKSVRPQAVNTDDAFWDLPPIHKRTYSPPTYDGRTTDTIPVSVEEDGIARTEAIPPELSLHALSIRPARI